MHNVDFNKDKFNIDEHLSINNELVIIDGRRFIEKGGVYTITNKKTGEIICGHNKVMLAGSEMMAMRLFDLEAETFVTPNYNTQLELDKTQLNTGNDNTLDYKAYLFCMGTSGCALGSQIKYEVSNKSWIAPADMIPFRYTLLSEDLDEVHRRIYFGRKEMRDKNRIAYYFKRFDSSAIAKRHYEDGSPWSASVYTDASSLAAQMVVACTMTVDEEDGRSYFDNTVGITDARFNAVEICAAWPLVGPDGYVYYQDIRPVTRLNFPNRWLSERGASFEIKYEFFF